MKMKSRENKMMLEKIKDKYVFFDVDGTLAEYRYSDHVSGRNNYGGQTWEELFFGDVFVNNRPLKTMVNLINQLDPNKVFVLGAITTNHEIDEKYEWFEKYYPSIKRENIIFVAQSEFKLIALEQYAKKLNIPKEDIVFVDDKHATIRETEEAGFKSYHVTSFME